MSGWGDGGSVTHKAQRTMNALVKRDIANLAAANLAEVTTAVKHRLKKLRYRPHVIDGRLAGTSLTLGV